MTTRALRDRQSAFRNLEEAPPPWLLLGYAALVPLVIIPLPIGESIGAADLLFPIGVLALAGRWSSIPRESRLLRTPLAWFAAFAALSALSTVVTLLLGGSLVLDSSSPFLVVRMYALYLPLALLATQPRLSMERSLTLLRVVLISMTTAVAVGLVLQALGVQLRDQQQRIWGEAGSQLRAGGLLGNSGDFGHLAALLGAGALTFGVVILRRPLLAGALALLGGYAVYAASSRAGFVHLGIVLVMMLPVYLRGRPVLAAVTTVVLATFTALLALWSLDIASESVGATLRRFDIFDLTGQSQFSASARWDTWGSLLALVSQHPWAGVGYGGTIGALGGRPGDNAMLTVLSDLGVPAGIAFIGLWLALLVAAFRVPDRVYRSVAIALVISEIAHMMTVDTHRMWTTTPISVLLIGLALRMGARQQIPSPEATR
jgi:hypothetical protein